MAKWYHFSLTVWVRLKVSGDALELAEELREYLELAHGVSNLELIDTELAGLGAETVPGEREISFHLSMSFRESQVEFGDPAAEALEEIEQELTDYLAGSFQVEQLEIDEELAVLLGESDEPDESSPTDKR